MSAVKVDNPRLYDTLTTRMPELVKELAPLNITAAKGDSLSVNKKGKEVALTYTTTSEFFRALSHLRGIDAGKDLQLTERADFTLLSFMLDCSRNGVINEQSFKSLVGLLAMMGYNSIMLYTEDTYEIPSEPFFGHLRGRLTAKELQFMDSYAAEFGIEVIPCIQTLAHLETMFKWPKFAPVNDTTNILLCEEEQTYELLDKMFASLADNLKSRRINIGMDEAHMVGLGKYLDRHGYQNRTDIMLRHLNRVVQIAAKYGFKCCMWSDMFFRLIYKDSYYPAMDAPRLPESVTSMVPKEVELIYWDYYKTTVEQYDNMFERHFDFDNNILFAGGAWRWNGLTPVNKFGLQRVIPGVQSCRKNNIKEIIVTAWGDNGNETSYYGALPQMLVYAEYLYRDTPDEAYLEKRLRQTADASYQDFLLLDIADTPDDYNSTSVENRSKTMLYNDPLLGIMDYFSYDGIGKDYQKAAEVIADAGKRNPEWQYIFDTQAALCSLLSIKANLGVELKAAYDAGNKKELERLAADVIPQALDRLDKFADAMRTQWYKECKTFGFEVIQIRLSGVKERLTETARRLKEYLSGQTDRIEELEQERLVRAEGNHLNRYQFIATPCML